MYNFIESTLTVAFVYELGYENNKLWMTWRFIFQHLLWLPTFSDPLNFLSAMSLHFWVFTWQLECIMLMVLLLVRMMAKSTHLLQWPLNVKNLSQLKTQFNFISLWYWLIGNELYRSFVKSWSVVADVDPIKSSMNPDLSFLTLWVNNTAFACRTVSIISQYVLQQNFLAI